MAKSKTSKSYSVGEVISEEQPLVHVIDSKQKSLKCDNCLKNDSPLKRCSKCLKMFYCNQNCQRNDWIWHKNECQIYLDHYNDFDDYLLRLMFRLWTAINKSEDILHKKKQLINGLFRSLNDFESHESEIRSDENRMKQFDDFCKIFTKYGISFDSKKLFKIYGQLLVNIFSIVIHDITYENEKSGYGVYICASVYDHSCRPNVSIIFDGTQLQIRAIRDIAKDEELFDQYIALDMSRDERRERLKSHYYFDCNCIKCCSGDQTIDYNRYKELLNKLHKSISDESVLMDSNTEIEELLSLCHQIYGDIHPELAAILMVVMQFRLLCPQSNCSSTEISAFIGRVGRIIELSFGSNHKFYRMFKMFVNIKNMSSD